MSARIKLSGKTKAKKQRFRCARCKKAFIWRRPDTKKRKEQSWFQLWVQESYSIRQLTRISGHSRNKLHLIKNRWLDQEPKEHFDYTRYKYLIFDGTYFHKKDCLIIMMDAESQKIIMNDLVTRESYKTTFPYFRQLRDQGLMPKHVTVDGHIQVIRALFEVWPQVIIQRCLYHIQRQGLSWLRTYPKTQAARELRELLMGVCDINDFKERDNFISRYKHWLKQYRDFVKSLPSSSVAYKDLKRTMALISNALPNMFHYLNDSKVESTCNKLESFYSRLKADYRRHRGLSEKHKRAYFHWYCCFQNEAS